MTEWTKHSERSNTFTLKLICYIALNVSREFARLLLWPITLYFFVSSPSSRFASHRYLQRVPGYKGNAWQVIRHIHHFSAVILDRVYFLTDQFDRFKIDIYDKKKLDKVISREKGAILLGTHVGSFEVLRCLALRRHKLPLKILMYKNHNAMITRILDELNPEIAKSVINLANPTALFEMKEALEKDNLVGMLGDRVFQEEKKISCDFLGEEVDFPAGPFKLAEMLGVPVIGFFGIYTGGNRYEIHHKLLYDGQKISRELREETVQKLMHEYVRSIEDTVKRHPYNWFNFYDYWGDKL
ncbi:MAG: lipid A biosynthesis acyltransferase [Gammaproteobacteria bacterium]|nr:lipid A biosynthesis acyltransferase [Gammaproteobacteria bacterium]